MNQMCLKLLVVDDKPAEREGIINITDWNNFGISIVGEAENGQDGIEKARQLKPDIIITDIVMPCLDGFKMMEEIKKFLPDIKVIFISCFDNFNFARLAINMDAMGYVLKPIIAGELLSAVGKVTGIHIREAERKKEEEDLIRRLRQNLPVIREQFVKDLLFGILKDENEIRDKNDFLEAGLYGGTYTVLAAECDTFIAETAELSEEKKQLLHLKIREHINKACEMSGVQAAYCVTGTEMSKYIILINRQYDNTNMDNFAMESCTFAENLKNELYSRLHMEFTIGVSSTVEQITKVNRCYQEACDALKFKFYLGKNQIISYSEIYTDKNAERQRFIDLQSAEDDLKYLIMTGDMKEIENFAENLLENQSADIDLHYIQYICISIVSYVQYNLLGLNVSLRDIYSNEYSVLEDLSKLDTIAEIKHWLKDLLVTVSSFLTMKDKSKNKKTIDAIKDYINANFTEDLTVTKIAENVYLSPCYTNYIFKKETGDTLMEYLTGVRISEAKKLLKNTHLKVYEVAEQVGYKSNSYFCSVFKEHCGMTPLEYRDRS